jgi:hypothetical protein
MSRRGLAIQSILEGFANESAHQTQHAAESLALGARTTLVRFLKIVTMGTFRYARLPERNIHSPKPSFRFRL